MLAVAAVGRPLVVLGELTVPAWLWATLVVATSAGGGGGGAVRVKGQTFRALQEPFICMQGMYTAVHLQQGALCVCVCVCACCRRCLVTVGGDGNGSQ